MPKGGLDALNNKNPFEIEAFQYDFVCNGYEMASGGVRNHSPEILKKAFELVGYGEDIVRESIASSSMKHLNMEHLHMLVWLQVLTEL